MNLSSLKGVQSACLAEPTAAVNPQAQGPIADVVADGLAACYVLTVERLAWLSTSRPALHARLIRSIMRGMADRLRRATEEIRVGED